MYFMVPWVVLFSFDPRRATQSRHVTKMPSPQLLLFPPLTNCDARNSFRICSYANHRVSLASERRFSQFCSYLSPFRMNTSKSVSKQRTLSTFRMNTYEKQGEGAVIVN